MWIGWGFWYGVPGGDLLSRARCSLSLALIRFTVLFEMGRGGSERLLPPSEGGGLMVLSQQTVSGEVVTKGELRCRHGVVIAVGTAYFT